MSRTKKGKPSPGKEYWTARLGNKGGQPLGKFSKRTTHRAERRMGKLTYVAGIGAARLLGITLLPQQVEEVKQ